MATTVLILSGAAVAMKYVYSSKMDYGSVDGKAGEEGVEETRLKVMPSIYKEGRIDNMMIAAPRRVSFYRQPYKNALAAKAQRPPWYRDGSKSMSVLQYKAQRRNTKTKNLETASNMSKLPLARRR